MTSSESLQIKSKIEQEHQYAMQKDEYAWLRDKNWPKVTDKKIISYLEDENKKSEEFFTDIENVTNNLYDEMVARIELKDCSVPYRDGEYFYYVRTDEDSKYSIICRKKDSLENNEQVILDCNQLAKGFNYFSLGGYDVNPNHQLLAYAIDVEGSERYTLRIKNLTNDEMLADILVDLTGEIIWHRKLNGFFYTKYNDNWRSDKVYFHKLGDEQSQDKLVFQEYDNVFRVGITESSDEKFLLISIESGTSSENCYIAMDDEMMVVHKLIARAKDKIYHIDHAHDKLYIISNFRGKNFAIDVANMQNYDFPNWQNIIPHDDDKYLLDFDLYQNHIAIEYRNKGQSSIKIANIKDYDFIDIQFEGASYVVEIDSLPFLSNNLRIAYSSLTQPQTILEYNFIEKTLSTIKVKNIKNGFDSNNYVSKKIWAQNGDVKIPISIIYNKNLYKNDGSNPLYLYGYGSYGIGMEPYFRSHIFSLIDRGFVFAIAHIRGGDELGYLWYESAKFLNKKLTFEDFLACANYLVQEKYTNKGNITICGGSAGGMLVGYAANNQPDLFKSVIAHVPFVDVLNTMMDDSLPLTTGEFEEWGNPKNEEYYEYIKSYSPYDNVKEQAYPAIYVTAGISDPRVTYWEPAKWVAKLRDKKQDNNLIIFETNMDAGHGGSSSRFARMKEVAKEYSFILKIYALD
jgi:oligopeptidase B